MSILKRKWKKPCLVNFSISSITAEGMNEGEDGNYGTS